MFFLTGSTICSKGVSERVKLPCELFFFEPEYFCEHALRYVNNLSTLKSVFDRMAHIENCFHHFFCPIGLIFFLVVRVSV